MFIKKNIQDAKKIIFEQVKTRYNLESVQSEATMISNILNLMNEIESYQNFDPYSKEAKTFFENYTENTHLPRSIIINLFLDYEQTHKIKSQNFDINKIVHRTLNYSINQQFEEPVILSNFLKAINTLINYLDKPITQNQKLDITETLLAAIEDTKYPIYYEPIFEFILINKTFLPLNELDNFLNSINKYQELAKDKANCDTERTLTICLKILKDNFEYSKIHTPELKEKYLCPYKNRITIFTPHFFKIAPPGATPLN